MGCVSSTGGGNSGSSGGGSSHTAARSKKKRVKILLLGAGESGKSTIAKQMKILHMKGFTSEEVLMYKKQVHRNVYENIRLLISAAEKLDIPLDDPATAQEIMHPDFMSDGLLTAADAARIKRLWTQDKGIRTTFDRGTEFHLIESARYYFDALDRIAGEQYTPSYDDILRSRRLTVNAEEIEFELGGYLFHFIDVGGQKGEREKWIDYFQNNDAVIFFVAMSEYDQKLAEDNATNRMAESLKLFSDICNHQWFANAAIILFLNKCDLFREKIGKVPLTIAFPEYRGKNDYEPASEYIKSRFLERVNNKKKSIYPFITCATNTENFKNIFESVKSVVIDQQMQAMAI